LGTGTLGENTNDEKPNRHPKGPLRNASRKAERKKLPTQDQKGKWNRNI